MKINKEHKKYLMRTMISLLILISLSLMGNAQSNQSVPETLERSIQRVPDFVSYPSDADEIFTIYPGNGIPSESSEWTWTEQFMPGGQMIRNVVTPTLTMFKPTTSNPNSTAVIIVPGGAFHFLSMDNEGYNVAYWLTQHGITAFVLKYRVQYTPENEDELPAFFEELNEKLPKVTQSEVEPPMTYPPAEEARLWGEEDGRQAIRFLRSFADKLDIDPGKIGIMGFSAGGGISVNAALEYDDLSRPDFVGGIYPGYRTVDTIPDSLPPLFIAISDDDTSVAPMSATRLYETWHKQSAPVELHVFTNGGHGFGVGKQDKRSDEWMKLYENWLVERGFINQ